jgi:hypothetical protein
VIQSLPGDLAYLTRYKTRKKKGRCIAPPSNAIAVKCCVGTFFHGLLNVIQTDHIYKVIRATLLV